MIIDNQRNRPPKVVFRPIWKCPYCGRTMIFEKGVNRWCGFKGRRTICFDCDTDKFIDAIRSRENESDRGK